MTAIFSRLGFLGLLLLIAGCSEREPAVIAAPKDAAAVIEPFLKELAAGRKDKAAAFVSTAATDELSAQFASDHAKLSAAPVLTPRFMTKTGGNFRAMGREFSSDGKEVTLVYAAKQNGKWTSATVRVYRYRDEPYKVEYWRIAQNAPSPAFSSGYDPEKAKQGQKRVRWTMAGLALLGVAGLGLLIWLLRRKPHLIVPEVPQETRKTATVVRD